MLQMQHTCAMISCNKSNALIKEREKDMKKLLSLAILLSLSVGNAVPVLAAQKTVLKAGAELSIDKNKKKESAKVKPTKNKYEYVNLAWWAQFNDEYLNDYIVKAVENNKDLKMATLTIDEYYQNVVMQRAGELPTLQAGFFPGDGKFIGSSSGGFALPIVANYELDLFGKNHNKTTAIRKLYEASILDE